MQPPVYTIFPDDKLRMGTAHTVSYTHLDVYKRQRAWRPVHRLVDLAGRGFRRDAQPALGLRAHDRQRLFQWQQRGPVSYTHLDVYKRQQLAMAELPEDQREVLELRLQQELSLEEIGQITGVGRETVKSRLRYAMDKLRTRLSE